MPAPVTRETFSALNSPDLFNVFVEEGLAGPLEYPFWINVSTMPWNPIKNRQASGMPSAPDKNEGERFPTRAPLLGNEKEHKAEPRGMAYEVTFEAWTDELYGFHQGQVASMRRGAHDRLENDAIYVLDNAFDSAVFTTFDGQALCSAAHTTLAGGTYSNLSTEQFGIAFIQEAVKLFHALPNEQGLPQVMQGVQVIIHRDNLYVARDVLGSSGTPYSADHRINSLIPDEYRYMVSHYLASSTAAFVLAAQGVHDLQMGVRNPIMFDSFDDPWTKNAVHTVYFRNTEGYADSPRGIVGTAG